MCPRHFINATIFKILWNICFSWNCEMAERAFQILPCTDYSSICRGFLSNVCLICRGNFEAVDKTTDSLIITFCGFWDLITFCGYRNKSSGIFHFEWWSISLSSKVNTCSWDSFCVSFSDNLYLQHLALGSIRKGWVSASRLNFVASPDLCTEERRAGLPKSYQRWVQCWTIFAAQSLISRRWF